MQNYYTLTDEIANVGKKLITDYIHEKWVEGKDIQPLNLTGVKDMNPARVRDVITDILGYDEENFDSNGWEWDFWFQFVHVNSKDFPPLTLRGTGLTHEMYVKITEG